MKIAFFAIFDPTWTHILTPTDPNMRLLKHNFNFQSLRKTEAMTKIKTRKIITFCYFWTKIAQNLVLIIFKCGISYYFDLQFPLRHFYNHYFLLLNVFLMQNMKKTPLIMPVSSFFHNIGPNLAQILHLRPHALFFC